MLYFTLSSSLNLHLGIFFYRFMMVVRQYVLEYIIALVFVKNKVRLKKCVKKFQIWQSSIPQINLSITSLRLISNGDLFQPHLKYTLTFCNTCTRTSRSRSFITTLFHSSVNFVPVLVKGLYQTESYSLHVMQLIRI